MRIIAGAFKGRPLKAPKGDATRPTTDRVRESLMSSIASARGGWEDCFVLDLFAGSGALGLEAISRGADSACFCERHSAALQALSSNASMVEKGRARIVRGDVTKRLPSCGGTPFNLLFLDPPYAMDTAQVAQLVERLFDAGTLAHDVLVVYEHDDKQDPLKDELFAQLGLGSVVRKKFGSTVIDLLSRGYE